MKNYYIGRIHTNGIKEGGVSRDFALYNFLKNKTTHIKITKHRILSMFRIFFLFLTCRNATIIMHYPFSGLALSDRHFISIIFRKFFIKLLSYTAKRNDLVIDIADLPVMQAKDLNLPIETYYQQLEAVVFSLKAHYIFSSFSMREYVTKKYSVEMVTTEVCINGGNELSNISIFQYTKYLNPSTITYVYAGTLNKGRQIEELISLFSKHTRVNLLLLGEGGEWITQYSQCKNIFHLGALEESIAHKLVSKCDIGIIPYDSNKFYYNLAYPTKLSFYITAGVTFLSTSVEEVKRINNIYHFGYVEPIEKWDGILKELSQTDILLLKQKIKYYQNKFYWHNIFNIEKFRDLI